MPSLFNPDKGWIATANNRPEQMSPECPISYDWCAPYRIERISQVLSSMKEPTPDAFRELQKDVHSLQADIIIPKLKQYQFTDKKAQAMKEMFLSWDRQVTSESAGAAAYNVFLTEWTRALLEDELGDNLKLYFHIMPAAYLVNDVILDRPDSPIWDRCDTIGKETPQEILEIALTKTSETLEQKMGQEPEKWAWGRLHTYYFGHPGASSKLEHKFLSRGPIPAPGDNTTVNAACYDPGLGGFGVIVIPSLRMIAPLGDLDKTTIAGPMGQSGQPGNRHYDDLIKPWMSAEGVPLYFNRTDVDKNAAFRLTLTPAQTGGNAGN
jgi:penicillin amidase